jgi:hypothetical protein
MSSVKKIIKADRGVVLTEVSLHAGAMVVATGYTVKSKRTPEVPNYNNFSEADAAYNAEVARCAA